MPDFLLEIGCEEIPARMIEGAMVELRERVGALLAARAPGACGCLTWLDTPRRLAVIASGVPAAQPDVTEQVHRAFNCRLRLKMVSLLQRRMRLPRKLESEVGAPERVTTPKGEYLSALP